MRKLKTIKGGKLSQLEDVEFSQAQRQLRLLSYFIYIQTHSECKA